MTPNQERQLIKHRALFAKEYADIIHNPNIREDAEKILNMLIVKAQNSTIKKTEAYKTILRIWYK